MVKKAVKVDIEKLADEIYEYLRKDALGPNNAKTEKKLAEHFDINGRTIRKAIQKLRFDNKPICSDCTSKKKGYFYPRDYIDAEHTLASLGSRYTKIYKAKRGIEQGLLDKYGPPKLFEVM